MPPEISYDFDQSKSVGNFSQVTQFISCSHVFNRPKPRNQHAREGCLQDVFQVSFVHK